MSALIFLVLFASRQKVRTKEEEKKQEFSQVIINKTHRFNYRLIDLPSKKILLIATRSVHWCVDAVASRFYRY